MGKDGSPAAKFQVGTRAKGGNRASASRKLKPIKHNGERHSEGFTGIAISHDHLIISQSCHFAFVELATCLECLGRCRRHTIVVREEQSSCQVLLAHHRLTVPWLPIVDIVPYGRTQGCIDVIWIPILQTVNTCFLPFSLQWRNNGRAVTVDSDRDLQYCSWNLLRDRVTNDSRRLEEALRAPISFYCSSYLRINSRSIDDQNIKHLLKESFFNRMNRKVKRSEIVLLIFVTIYLGIKNCLYDLFVTSSWK